MSNFRFLDDTDAQRQLGVDRLTFEELLRTKRLRPVSGMGTIQFFRVTDIARLRAELEQEAEERVVETAPRGLPPQNPPTQVGNPPAPPTDEARPTTKPKKAQDPAMRVHVRLTADLKWYDISDADLQAWFDQLHPETYARRRANALFVMQRMQQIVALIDAGQAQLDAASGGGGSEVEG
jgi:hypothetical protein